ncbi:MAG: aldehyde ferredoxin oxidoreductase C-terminal domain-containing protein [Candidatus Hodarchaeota archaeon]
MKANIEESYFAFHWGQFIAGMFLLILSVTGFFFYQEGLLNFLFSIPPFFWTGWVPKAVAELYSAATGIEKTPKELLKDAERVFNLSKALNAREGFTRKDDSFPDKWFKPLKRPDRGTELILRDYFDDTKIITKEESERMLGEYYEERGWDVVKGIPIREKLAELGLEYVAEDMEKL